MLELFWSIWDLLDPPSQLGKGSYWTRHVTGVLELILGRVSKICWEKNFHSECLDCFSNNLLTKEQGVLRDPL